MTFGKVMKLVKTIDQVEGDNDGKGLPNETNQVFGVYLIRPKWKSKQRKLWRKHEKKGRERQ